jgi:hypothetical protein
LAERVGFAPSHVVENKELTGIHLPHNPPETFKDPGRRTYYARGAIYGAYMARIASEASARPRTAKVFMTNRSQAVRLPREYQFSTDEVFIRKEGEDVIL